MKFTIKNSILLVFIVFMMVGCYQAEAYNNKQIDLVGDYKIKTIVYQGCEYVVMDSHYKMHSIVTHKGNCRFCKERKKQELKELVEQLKK